MFRPPLPTRARPKCPFPNPPLPTLPIVSADVPRQFARRGDLSEAQFLYGEVARRMLGRLQSSGWRRRPCWTRDVARATTCRCCVSAIRTRPTPAWTTASRCWPPRASATRRAGWAPGSASWRAGPAAPAFINGDLAQTGLAPESLELVWSNLALHWHRAPHAALAEWRRVLKVGGLAMFSCLGPATLRELRQALADAGLRTATPSFVDMHDFGDLLVENGFADPVMDQEILTLTYRSPENCCRTCARWAAIPPKAAAAAGGPELARPALCGAGSPAPPRRRDRAEHRSGLRPCLAGRRAPRRHRRDAVVGQRHRRTPARNP